MTIDDFRVLALALPRVTESAHMGHPDFRVNGKIFATLNYPDEHWGMVKLPPAEQHKFAQIQPDVFVPVKGAWGRQGATNVRLEAAEMPALEQALYLAWHKAQTPSKPQPARHQHHQRRCTP